MSEPRKGWTDEQVEQVLGNLLRAGVVLAALVVLAGGIIYLIRHGDDRRPNYEEFKGEEGELRSPTLILEAALELRSGGLIQLGLLILLATPVARVVFSVFAFARQRDFTYVFLTLIVLAVLLYSLFSGYLAG
jgi:uncharacterized membrane protein